MTRHASKPQSGRADAGAERFDRSYYDRFYRDPRTRVYAQKDIDRLGRFVASYLAHLGQPVTRVLDVGCGLGHWRRVIAEHYPRARYLGVEVSEYLCQKLGWQRGSVVDFRPRGRFDLVICQGVLQYLDRADAIAAIANLGRWCRGALYLEALTAEDWRDNCDRRATDGNVHLRSAAFYRRHLGRDFRACGGGLYLSRDSDCVLYALEGQ